MNNSRGAKFSTLSFLIILFAFSAVPFAGAQVDSDELEISRNERIIFINYEGPHSRIETLEQIHTIGVDLGNSIKAGNARAGASGRYYIIHSQTEAENGKLDADIMGLGVDVGVDHIRNLRVIIQGYLETAYGYSAEDALLLAEYITIYNAVYRGNWDFYAGRYKTPVISQFNRDKAGLSTRFDEWPGRTEMIIPLGVGIGGPTSAIDTSSLTEEEIIDEMRQQDDRGIEQRKDMVDLKEREAEEAGQKAAGQREAIREEERRIQEEKTAITQEKTAIAQEKQQQAEQPAPDPEKDEEIKQREEETAQREEAVAQEEQELEEKKEEAEKTEEFAEQKAAEAQEERQSIAQDQQSLITQEDAQTGEVTGYLGIRMNDPVSFLSQLVRIKPSSGEIIKASPLNTINARTINFSGKLILAIAGEKRSNNSAIRLVQIDMDSLEMLKQGDDDVHPQSLLWMNNNDLYAVTVTDGKLYLAKYSTALERLARSTVSVHPNATVLFQGDAVLTQRTDGTVLFLSPSDLSELSFPD